jgi:cell division protein ZapA
LPKLPKPRTIDVEIYDQKYSIVLKADIQEAEIRRVADDVDERMREISAVANTPDSLKIAVLTALHLAQELREARRNSEQNDIIIRKKSDEWTHALEQLLTR